MEAILIIVEKYGLVFLDYTVDLIIDHRKIFDLLITSNLNKHFSGEYIILLTLDDARETWIAILKIGECCLTWLILNLYRWIDRMKLSHEYLELTAFLDNIFLKIDWERQSIIHSTNQDISRMLDKQENTRKKSDKNQNEKRRKRKEGISPNISKRVDKYSHTELETNREVIVFNWEEKSKGKFRSNL